MAAPCRLRIEHLDHPLGIIDAAPRLSWQLPLGTERQLAYQVRVGMWDSGRVVSDQSILVPYGGPALRSGERVEWTVRVWTDKGRSDWAEPGWWEMGLLGASDWAADWISPPDINTDGTETASPVWLLRGVVTLNGPLERARLYVTADGIYEFFINGQRVGDLELTPGFTSYDSRLQVQTYDVTALLNDGENVLGAVLSGGWVKWTRRYRHRDVALLAQLQAYSADGTVTFACTGADWAAAVGSIRAADLQQGQVVDFREEMPGWCSPGANTDGWKSVNVRYGDLARLTSSPAPPVRRVEELRPVAITRPKPDRQVVDLGQNINGWVRLTKLGPDGTILTLTHGEAVDDSGDVSTYHLTDGEPTAASQFQTDRVTSGRPSHPVFEPRHATKGFRHLRVEGHPDDLDIDDVTGVVVHTDMRRTGWFECSDERINRLHEAAVWSFRGNACDIPTDCPTRERAGWTGDWQIFVPTAAFLYDVAGFSTKWLRDLAADQRPDGVVWHCAPNAEWESFYDDFPPGSAGWGDAAVIVPWEIYKAYGDRDLLERQWPSMTRWVDYAARMARERRHPDRIAARPVPAPHEQYLWDTGFHWGEWLEPDMVPGSAGGAELKRFVTGLRAEDHGPVATAYLYYSARLMAKIAAVLEREREAAQYRSLASAARLAWQQEFIQPNNTLKPDTQANYVRALAFDLVPDILRADMAERLVDLISKTDGHLSTGFLSTSLLLPVLADNGYLDVAYELLRQNTEPSWLAMLDRGATTVWEHWHGLDDDGLPDAPAGVGSLNHYSKGAVISFLHRYVSGIQIVDDAPGYQRFRISPMPGGGLKWARAVYESPYGRVESSWQVEDEEFVLDVYVPPNTTAAVLLPDGQGISAPPGRHRYRCDYVAFKGR